MFFVKCFDKPQKKKQKLYDNWVKWCVKYKLD